MQKTRILNTVLNKLKTLNYAGGEAFEYEAVNEKILDYKVGSEERQKLETTLKEYINKESDVPICIGDEEIKTNQVLYQKYPFDHKKSLAKFYYADEKVLNKAIKVSLEARDKWDKTPLKERSQIFLKAADKISSDYRYHMLATTMLGQAKTIHQAEIDAAAELIDFFRFNIQAATQLTKYKPISTPGVINEMVWRGMEGFWAAIAPFNFTAIGGNLASAPALMGNTVLWKPTDTAILSNYTIYRILRECGLPPGVINFVPSDGPLFGRIITINPNLAGINFTGSVKTFQILSEEVGKNIKQYTSFPRLIGECGGKNFHFIHHTADLEKVCISTVRSAFEFGGQKCSACSRLYVPESKWKTLKDMMINILKQVKVDSPLVKDTFYSAVIDKNAFNRNKSYIEYSKNNNKLMIEYGGQYDDSVGYYIQPTIIRTTDPTDKIMKEEIFGPILSVYVYPDSAVEKTLELVDLSTPFGLTGAIFSEDDVFIEKAIKKLRHATGNFYINVQSTGSVVGQQPFGGSRLSGTNDKAGGPFYVLKFTSLQSVKIQTGPIQSWKQLHTE